MADLKTILLLSKNPVGDYVARIKSGVEGHASSSGFKLVSINTYGSEKTIQDVLEFQEFAGIILTPPFSDDRHSLLAIEARGIPYVRIAPLLDIERGSSVNMDEFAAAAAITSVLLNKGHRRIAILRGPSSHLVSMRRYNGYAYALGGKGVRVDQALVEVGGFTRESAREQASKLFAAKPTAIFACNDEMAAGIVDAATKANIKIPTELSLVGYDDAPIASAISPSLTTVRQPLDDMGRTACELLLGCLNKKHAPNEHKLVPFEIVERKSVADFEG